MSGMVMGLGQIGTLAQGDMSVGIFLAIPVLAIARIVAIRLAYEARARRTAA